MNKRVKWVDIARGIAIILVVFGHLLPDDNFVKSMIYCFHMPFFFIVSGMFLDKVDLRTSIEKRIKSIYIPYFIWALIFSTFSIKNVCFILYGTNEALISAGSNGMLWFLLTLFFSGIVAVIVLKICKSKYMIFFAVIAFVILSATLERIHDKLYIGLPLSIDIVFLAVVYIIIGNVYVNYYNGFDVSENKKILRLIVGIVFILTSVVAVYFKTSKGYPQMATLDVGNVPIYFIASVLPCLGIVFVAKTIEKIKFLSNILIWLGKNTMAVFIFHRTVIYTCKDMIYKYSIHLFIPCFLLCLIYCCIAAAIVNKLCPWLVGKSKQ